ncbi:MAG TPA: DUF4232 domain-containing protein [Gaiellaceae bacterium]|nr:DUF4232 domain-containing protein [Gaiellaceae bacterium]
MTVASVPGLILAAILAGPSTAAPARAAVARCATPGLVVWLDTRGDGAAGSVYYKLELTNLSGQRCTLDGYPGVSAVDLGRHQLGSPAGRNPHLAPHAITLGKGATATAVLQITEAGNFPAATCRKETAAGLRVFPPGATSSEIVPFPFSACSRPGPVYLHVEAVAKSSSRTG